MLNSLGQGPCDVTAALGGVCTGGGESPSRVLQG